MGLQIEINRKLTCDQCGKEIYNWTDGVIQVIKNEHTKGTVIRYSYLPMVEIEEVSPGEELTGEILHNNWSCLEAYQKARVYEIHNWMKTIKEKNESKEISVTVATEESANAEPSEEFVPF